MSFKPTDQRQTFVLSPGLCERVQSHFFLPHWSTLAISFTAVRREKCSSGLLLKLSSYTAGSIKHSGVNKPL